ncbi:hypothetical protein ACLB2K_022417 [Fragaria x ananassa]
MLIFQWRSMNSINEEDPVPGGSLQTQNYYTNSSSRRQKSLDRSNSIRKTAVVVVVESEMAFRGSDPVIRGGDSASVVGNWERKDCKQKSRRWNKTIWSFIQRRI